MLCDSNKKGPIVMKPMFFHLWSIYVFLLLFVLKRLVTNRGRRITYTPRVRRIIIPLCIQSQDDIFLQPERKMQTCPFIGNVEKISGPKRSINITDHFTCTSVNVIYCITYTLCKKLCIGQTGRRLGDRFREHLLEVENDDKNASKPVARHFNLPDHSKQWQSSTFPTSRK